MNGSAVYAMYPDSIALNDVLQALGEVGFEKESICMMLSPKHPISEVVRNANTHAFERAESAAAAGLIGWLSKFGAVLIPTFGFFIRSKEFFQALVVEQDSMPRFGRCGALLGLGFSKHDAERFENRVREMGALLYVGCPRTAQKQRALELLRAAGAEEAGFVQSERAAATAA
jgi:hypothetical protein